MSVFACVSWSMGRKVTEMEEEVLGGGTLLGFGMQELCMPRWFEAAHKQSPKSGISRWIGKLSNRSAGCG